MNLARYPAQNSIKASVRIESENDLFDRLIDFWADDTPYRSVDATARPELKPRGCGHWMSVPNEAAKAKARLSYRDAASLKLQAARLRRKRSPSRRHLGSRRSDRTMPRPLPQAE